MFLLGFATGAIAGVILMALCVASRESEDREERELNRWKENIGSDGKEEKN